MKYCPSLTKPKVISEIVLYSKAVICTVWKRSNVSGEETQMISSSSSLFFWKNKYILEHLGNNYWLGQAVASEKQWTET